MLAGDAWIADGNYHETLDLRLERADTIVVLNTPWHVCAGRALLRGVRSPQRAERRREVGRRDAGRVAELRDAGNIWRKRRSEPDGQHAALHVLRSERAASEFLDRLDVGQMPADDD